MSLALVRKIIPYYIVCININLKCLSKRHLNRDDGFCLYFVNELRIVYYYNDKTSIKRIRLDHFQSSRPKSAQTICKIKALFFYSITFFFKKIALSTRIHTE